MFNSSPAHFASNNVQKTSCNACSTAAALKNAAAAVTSLAPLNYCNEVQLQ